MAKPKTKTNIQQIKKRDGRIVAFEVEKVERAIWLAAKAAGGQDKKKAKYLTGIIIQELENRFNATIIPEVEQVQDIVEKILLKKGHIKTHKSYTLYRDLHSRLRDITSLVDSDELIQKYLDKASWLVKENANMTYSLQGLNNHVASIISANFWLNKIYTRDVRKAHLYGDMHIHDLALISAYCTGWDLKDLLMRGFGGVTGKVNSSPPKHFRTSLGQLVNFFYTLQGEVAGAVAVANFDTYLAPFIAFDKLTYKEVKQSMQEFVYNMNVPTRVGFQCLSEDTEILTKEGWKNYQDMEVGNVIKTFNLDSGKIEDQKVKSVFKKPYKGKMYNLKNRISDQLISPKHRVVRKKFQTDNKFVLEPIEEIIKLKSPFIIPIAGKNSNKKAKTSNEQIQLMAWIISEGTIERPTQYRCCYRVSIYQSKIKNREKYEEIKKLLDHFKFNYSEYETASLGNNVVRFRLNAESSRTIHQWFGTKENVHFIPDSLLNLDEQQSKIFLETYLKADGTENCKITTTDLALLDDLQMVVVNCGYGFSTLVRKPTIGNKDLFIIRIIRHKETYIQSVKQVDYEGIIWCPHTKNETVIARRKGKVFITGNTPFTNVTLDLLPPKIVGEEAVIIGGKPTKFKYKDFQKEMDMFNRAFAEILAQGDSQGRVFTFPIPTYSITKDFNWENPVLEPIFEMTRKYGIPYWANYVNSDMKPEDTRSMCPLAGEEKVLIKSSRGRGLEYSEIRNIYEGNKKNKEEYEIYSDGQFIKGKFNKFNDQRLIEVILENGHHLKQSVEHLNFVKRTNKAKTEILRGNDLKSGMYLPYSLKSFQGLGGNRELGYFVGAYAGDGSLNSDTSVIFSLENERKKQVIKKLTEIAIKYFGGHTSVKQDKKTKLFTLKIHSQAAVGLCKDFVEGKERVKHYKARLYGMSLEFRQGAIEGHYATDGGNRNRIYTSSPQMVETLNMLAATLGTTTSIYEDCRTNRLGKEINYAVLIYQLNRKNYGSFWFKEDEKLWVKIKIVRELNHDTAYCFEVKHSKPIFTVGTTGILTHNCRLRLDNRMLRKRGGIFAANPLTGSVGVVTINLPRIGYLSKTKKEFFSKLERIMNIARDSLIIKRKTVEEFTEQGLYPYCRFYLSDVKLRTGNYWSNHFNTIGINGMNEAIENLMDKNIADEEGKKFALEVMEFMKKKLLHYQKTTGQLFNLEATPAEGTAYRFAKIDTEKYPDIKTANGFKAPFYTNSTHLPVDYTDDIFEALDHQDDLQASYNGGTVLHGFLGESLADTKSVKNLIKKIAFNYRLPYFTITPTFSICPKHGYLNGEWQYCPKCDAEIDYSKTTEAVVEESPSR